MAGPSHSCRSDTIGCYNGEEKLDQDSILLLPNFGTIGKFFNSSVFFSAGDPWESMPGSGPGNLEISRWSLGCVFAASLL